MSDRFVEECRMLLGRALAGDDLEIDRDDIIEILSHLADQVFSLEWDSGGPGGGAGMESVYQLSGKYFTASVDFGWDGPYESLDEALGGRVLVTSATQEIQCSEWSEEELIARMKLHQPPGVITINGTDWPLERLEHEVQKGKMFANGVAV